MAKDLESKVYTDESPIQVDFNRVVNHDDDGNEFITYEEFDYPKYQQSLGKWNDWSLDSLLKAGIDPAFPIHTGMNTRLEGVDVLNGIISDLDAALAPEMEKSND